MYKYVKGVLFFKSEKDFITITYSNKKFVNKYIYNKIKIAILLNIEKVYLFKIGHEEIYLKNTEWLVPLTKCLYFFEKEEEYEKCQSCSDLIKLL